MNIKEYSHPDQLERYSFLWSEARLVIAAVALLIGGRPVLLAILPVPMFFGLVRLVLTLSWLISGAVSGYLLYRWVTGNKVLFGKKDQPDLIAFLISVVSGINLGLTGLTGNNIGMSILGSKMIFIVTAIMYLAVAGYLFKRWNESGKKVF
ncbi:MAG: hypothetical protein AAB372_00305 [Patescibacteria group bacterium]